MAKKTYKIKNTSKDMAGILEVKLKSGKIERYQIHPRASSVIEAQEIVSVAPFISVKEIESKETDAAPVPKVAPEIEAKPKHQNKPKNIPDTSED